MKRLTPTDRKLLLGLEAGPCPASDIPPGLLQRLVREGLADVYRTVYITDAGRAALVAHRAKAPKP